MSSSSAARLISSGGLVGFRNSSVDYSGMVCNSARNLGYDDGKVAPAVEGEAE